MKPRPHTAKQPARRRSPKDLGPLLTEFIDMRHPLVRMADNMPWESIENYWQSCFSNAGGPTASSGRLASGLLMLKHMEALSDEALIKQWVSNPYYQYVCGEIYFQHRAPIDPSTLSKWRRRLGEPGMEWLLTSVLESAVNCGALKRGSLAHLCIDSTVMEKHIAYPTDSGLLEKVRKKLVDCLRIKGLTLRQSYSRQGPRLAQQVGRFAHARQFKRMRRALNKQCTWVGRLVRELERQLDKLSSDDERATALNLNAQARQLIAQCKNPKIKKKLYSLHEPDVDCISKGKARQRYEFGTKVGIASTQTEGFIVGIRSYPGNPYDGHTLDDQLEQAAILTEADIRTVVVDLGYRGRHEADSDIIHRGRKLSKRQKKRLRRRSALEATIGHMKNDGLLNRCHLKGKVGDALHAILCGVGHNLRLLRAWWEKQLLAETQLLTA